MRCPYCGSNKMYLGEKTDGYSVKKGLVGTALLGPMGAVAGINGRKKEVFICPTCGNNADTPMDSETSAKISKALSLNDVSTLHQLKASYPNIEWNESLTKAAINNTLLRGDDSKREKNSDKSDAKSSMRLFIKNSRRIAYDKILTSRMGKFFSPDDISLALLELVESEAIVYEGGGIFSYNLDYKETSMMGKNEEARKKAELFIRFQERKKKEC